MSDPVAEFLDDHNDVTRRWFIKSGAVGITAAAALPALAETDAPPPLQKAIENLETWLTRQDDFRNVSRGNPRPHNLSPQKRKEVGLTRDTWKLEVISDPRNPARIKQPFSKAKNNAFTFADLMKLAKTNAVRFPKVMTCLNIGCPLGNGIWEGVPLRDVLWLTQPTANLRRVFYHGYHNDDPKQMFRSSLPVGRVLEDPFGLPPVILCYKLNGGWLTPERGGPVRIVFPEGYGFKSIKWLNRIYLSNIATANDTYAKNNNDVDSDLKTFCATLSVPERPKPGVPLAITGYAQVGISGLKKVQFWIQNQKEKRPSGDPHFIKAPWRDAQILPAPDKWGGDLPQLRIPQSTREFDNNGKPLTWPIRLAKAHWATLHPGLAKGKYTLRCRTVDDNGIAQPMPRPFRKSGRASIEEIEIVVE